MKFDLEEKVNIMISARHVHLTSDVINELFGHELNVKNKLNQVGQFAAKEIVTIETNEGKIENVRVVGPARDYNQVEISASDARRLGIKPPVRKSGVLDGASFITIKTEKNSISGNFAIIADRHVHFSPLDAKKYGIVDNEDLYLEINGVKPGAIMVKAKVSEDGYYEAHLDTDDANAFLINSGDVGILRK